MAPLFATERTGRHVVLDDVLASDVLEALQSELFSSSAWHYRAQPGKVLCQTLDVTGIALAVADEVARRLQEFDTGLVVFERWAFLHQRPFEEFVHTDVGAYVFTLWLTPERWDRSPQTSGLRLYSLTRPAGMANTRDETSRFFHAEQPPTAAYVRYRENRAVVFPASTFHSIGPCYFEGTTANRMRCSMTVILDHPQHWRQQHRRAQ
jgi:hypothetical protein